MKHQLTRKDADPGKDRRQKEKGAAEREMVGPCHPLSGHAFERAPGGSAGQRSPVRAVREAAECGTQLSD